MKGFIKAAARTPHQLTSRVGMSAKSQDPETNDLVKKFAGLEEYAGKLIKDSQAFREAVNNALTSSSSFSLTLTSLFAPLSGESPADLRSRYPSAAQTMDNLEEYQGAMAQLREDLAPELELVDSRILAPTKEFVEILKKVRKTVTKRDHKLVDYDRHNNTYTKLRDKKEKSLKDEQNLFKAEQEFEVASDEYNRYNDLLKQEIPILLQHATAFITPLFHSFYFMQLNIIYTMYTSLQNFAGEKGYNTPGDVQAIYSTRIGDLPAQVDGLPITKRIMSTARMMSQAPSRQGTLASTSSGVSRTNTYAASPKASYGLPPPSHASSSAAPPAYTTSPTTSAAPASASTITGKRPPPPPPPKPRQKAPDVKFVTALYDFAAQAEGDLSFSAGERIELVERTGSTEDWWTGRVGGRQGVFPGNYVQEDQ